MRHSLATVLTYKGSSCPRAATGFQTQHVSPDNLSPLSPNMSAVEDSASTSSEGRANRILHPGLATAALSTPLDPIAEDAEAARQKYPRLSTKPQGGLVRHICWQCFQTSFNSLNAQFNTPVLQLIPHGQPSMHEQQTPLTHFAHELAAPAL